MAQLDEIVSKSHIQGVLDLDKALISLDETFMKVLKSSKETSTILNTSTQSFNQLKTVQEQTTEQTKKLGEAEKQAEKIAKDQAAAVASLEKQRQAAYAQMAKQEQKERELTAAINMEVKSISDAEKQNKALLEAKKKLNLTTEEGKKKNQEYNAILNKNTEYIRANSDAATKQRMNIGNYGSALKGVGTQILSFVSGLGAGITAMAAFKAVMSSTEAISDSFARNIEGVREGFGFLARSIANLDFTNLIQGFRDAFSEGKRYADVLDEIEDRERALGIRQKEIEGQILDQKVILKSNAQTVQAKEAAIAEIIRLQKVQLDETQTITKQGLDNQLQNAAAEVFGAKQVTDERKALILDFVSASGEAFDAYQAKLDEASALEAKLNSLIRVSVDDRGRMAKDMYAYNKALSELNPQQKELLDLLQISNGIVGQKRDLIAEAAKADISAVNAQKEGLVSLERYENQLRNEYLKQEKEQTVVTAKESDERVKIAQNEADRKLEINDMTSIQLKQSWDNLEVETLGTHIKTLELREQADIDFIEREDERLKAQHDKRLQMAQEYVAQSQQIGQTLLDFNQFLIDTETSKMEQAKAYELQLAGDNADKRAEIEKKYDKEASKLKAKQARQDKAQALFSAIIKTAQAVLAGLAYGPPLGYVFAALNAVLGAIQIGVIASQPIPQFFKGTKSAPDGLISVAEKGQEMIKTRSGKILMATRPTLLSGMKGATIYSNKETEEILKMRNVGYDSPELRRTLEKNNQDLIRTIKNKKEIYITPAKNTRVTERDGAYFKTYFNRKLGG